MKTFFTRRGTGGKKRVLRRSDCRMTPREPRRIIGEKLSPLRKACFQEKTLKGGREWRIALKAQGNVTAGERFSKE